MNLQPLLVLFLAAPLANAAEPPAPPSPPLRPVSHCLVPDQVRNWGVIDDRRLVVETLGQRYYDVQLTADCSDLRKRPLISFRDGSSMGLVGTAPTLASTRGASDHRICGDIGDAVVPHGQAPGVTPACDIARIRRIEAATFEGVLGKSAQEGNALLDAAPEPPAVLSVSSAD